MTQIREWLSRVKWRIVIVFVMMGIGGVYGVLPVTRAVLVAHPPRKAIIATAPMFPCEKVTFLTDTDLQVYGWHIPSHNGAAIIIAHGYGGNRGDHLEQAQFMAEHGYGVLLLDLLAHGESEGHKLTLSGQEILAAVRYFERQGSVSSTRIGVWGFSLGGLVGIQAAAQTRAIDALIADGPFPVVTHQDMPHSETVSDWLWMPFDIVQWQALRVQGVRPATSTITALQRSSCGVLLIAGRQNRGEYRVMQKYAAVPSEHIELWEVEEAGHVESWSVRGEEYRARVLAFFDQALLGEEPTTHTEE
ncbi:MAG: alpha/beta fold hydrolase [Anaerolineae bacterium]|nr:alpha/beta fold hydrolase [Anaerolineae bacterium]